MQGTPVRFLAQEDPTCCVAPKSVCHNCWACEPKLLSPMYLEPVRHERNHRDEKAVHCNERVAPASCN